MNPWEDPNYYGISNALDDAITHFAKQKHTNPLIDEICEVVTPLFKRAGVDIVGKAEKEALDSTRIVMHKRIQKRMNELLEYTDYVI